MAGAAGVKKFFASPKFGARPAQTHPRPQPFLTPPSNLPTAQPQPTTQPPNLNQPHTHTPNAPTQRVGRLGDAARFEIARYVLQRGLAVNPGSACLAQAWGLLELQRCAVVSRAANGRLRPCLCCQHPPAPLCVPRRPRVVSCPLSVRALHATQKRSRPPTNTASPSPQPPHPTAATGGPPCVCSSAAS